MVFAYTSAPDSRQAGQVLESFRGYINIPPLISPGDLFAFIFIIYRKIYNIVTAMGKRD